MAAPPPSWELSMAAADWRLYTTWNMRARDLPEAPATEDRLCVCACLSAYICANACVRCASGGWQSVGKDSRGGDAPHQMIYYQRFDLLLVLETRSQSSDPC